MKGVQRVAQPQLEMDPTETERSAKFQVSPVCRRRHRRRRFRCRRSRRRHGNSAKQL